MCDFLSTAYRKGAVIEAKRASDTDPSFKNSFRTARLIGKSISGRADAYIESILASQKFNEVVGVELAEKNELVARFDPGIIIDFPRISIKTQKWDFSTRSCLTICTGGSQSKIWTRLVLIVQDEKRKLTTPDLIELRSLSENLAEASNAAIKAQYEKDFSGVVGEPVTLENFGKIDVFAVDCVGLAISQEIKNSYTSLTQGLHDSRHLSAGEISDVLRNIASISMPPSGQDSNEAPEFTLHDNANFVPFRSSKGVESLFVAATRDGHAYLGGLVDAGPNVGSPFFDEMNMLPYSLSSTAELASEIGSVY